MSALKFFFGSCQSGTKYFHDERPKFWSSSNLEGNKRVIITRSIHLNEIRMGTRYLTEGASRYRRINVKNEGEIIFEENA